METHSGSQYTYADLIPGSPGHGLRRAGCPGKPGFGQRRPPKRTLNSTNRARETENNMQPPGGTDRSPPPPGYAKKRRQQHMYNNYASAIHMLCYIACVAFAANPAQRPSRGTKCGECARANYDRKTTNINIHFSTMNEILNHKRRALPSHSMQS